MKRSVLLTAAMGAALSRAAFADDLTIATTTTSPVATSTAANGSPGNITISSAGSVSIATAGAAVTLDSNNSVLNSGTISNSTPGNSTGLSILAGTGSFSNFGTISVLGVPGTDENQLGVLLRGNGTFTGNIIAASGSTVTVAGLDAQAIAIQSELAGNLTLAGSVQVSGTSAYAVKTIAQIDGAFMNFGNISATGGGTSTTVANPSPGSAVAIGGNVSGGILNAGPLNSADTTAPGNISVVGTSPALIISPTVNVEVADVHIGVLADTNNPGYSFINRGRIASIGEQVSIATTAVQIGNSGLITGLSGGIYNSGSIIASATSDNSKATAILPGATPATAMIIGTNAHLPILVNDVNGTISAATGGPQGGTATAISIAAGGAIASLNNAGTILASANATDPSIASLLAVAIQDASGSLTSIVNSGNISAIATVLNGGGQSTVAANLATAATPVTFTNSGAVVGSVMFGSSIANQLTIEGPHASVTGQVTTAGIGRVNLAVSAGGTGGSLTTSGAIRAGTLTVGPGGILNMTINPTSNGISASGAASFAATSRLQVESISVLPADANITLVHSDTLLTFADFGATTAGIQIPFLYNGNLTSDANNVVLSLQRKSAGELGLTGNAATIYEPAMLAATTDTPFGVAVAGLGSTAEVQSTVLTMLPIMSGATKAMAGTITDSTTDAVALRQRTLTLVPDIETGGATWAEVFYDQIRNTASNGYTGHGIAAAGGIDFTQPGKGHYGIAVTYYRGDAHERDRPDDASTATWFLAEPYMGLRAGNVFINAQVNAGAANVHSERIVQAGSVVRNPTSDATQWLASGGITGGYVVNLGAFSIIPEANVNALDLVQNNFAERDGGTGVDLAIKSRNDTSVRAFAGIAAGGSYAAYGGHIVPQIQGGWSHELVRQNSSIDGSFAEVPDTDFSVPGPGEQRSRFVGGGSLGFVADKWLVSLGADASVESKALAETARLMVAARF